MIISEGKAGCVVASREVKRAFDSSEGAGVQKSAISSGQTGYEQDGDASPPYRKPIG